MEADFPTGEGLAPSFALPGGSSASSKVGLADGGPGEAGELLFPPKGS